MDKWKGTALALALALALTGCGQVPAAETAAPTPTPVVTPTATPAEERVFALAYSPAGGLHPITGTSRVNLTFAPLIYRGLFALDSGFDPRPDLCESYTVSGDSLVWTFALAPATFSDGSPLTATEVVASLNLARRSGRFADRLADIKSVGVQGETVVVTLSRPNGDLPALLDVPIVKETGEDWPMGTGPYSLVRDGLGLSLKLREGEELPLTHIPLRSAGAGDDLVYAFDAGEVSLVDTDLTGTNALGFSGRLETTDYGTTTLLYVGMNTAKTSPCADGTVRQAAALSVQRDSVVSRCLDGHGAATAQPISPNAHGWDSSVEKAWGYDPAEAARRLEEAGWSPNEEGILQKGRDILALRLVVNQDNDARVAAAELVGEGLAALGCAVTVDKLPWDDFVTALEKGEFDLYLGETAMTADFDPEPLVGTGGALNYGKFSDEDLDDAIHAWRGAQGEERRALYPAAAIAQAAPIVPLCFKCGSVLTQWGQVSGMAPTQRDIFAGLEGWVLS